MVGNQMKSSLKKDKLIIGSRGSALALWQANFVKRELEKNQQLQTLITKEDDLIGETILKSIAADTGDFDLTDYMEYKNNPEEFLKKLRENKADGGRIGYADGTDFENYVKGKKKFQQQQKKSY